MDSKSKHNLHVVSYFIRQAYKSGDLETVKKYLRLICKSEINPRTVEKSKILEALDDILNSCHSKIPCMLAKVCKRFIGIYIDENISSLKSGAKAGTKRRIEDLFVTPNKKRKLTSSESPQIQ